MTTRTITRSHICGVTCQRGTDACNGYCHDNKVPHPASYEATLFDFGDALRALKTGERMKRAAWPRGVFVYYVPAAAYPAQTGVAKAHFGESALVPYKAYLAIKQAGGEVGVFVPGMDSLLAEDWELLD
jgi:hypothetical protein